MIKVSRSKINRNQPASFHDRGLSIMIRPDTRQMAASIIDAGRTDEG